MKDLIGRPGSVSGLALRVGQCAFASAAIGVMVSALGFSSFTAFWYLLFSFVSVQSKIFWLVVFISHII